MGRVVVCRRCLHSLSRSTKLLRTSLVDAAVWRPCLSLLELRDEECLSVATGVLCNLLLAFSPSRKVCGGRMVLGYWCVSISNSLRTHNSSLEGVTELKFAPFCSSSCPLSGGTRILFLISESKFLFCSEPG